MSFDYGAWLWVWGWSWNECQGWAVDLVSSRTVSAGVISACRLHCTARALLTGIALSMLLAIQ